MPRFYFHFRDGAQFSRDERGVDFDSFEEAYLDAFKAAQEIWLDCLKERRDPRTCAFEITDDRGRHLLDLPFQEILDVCRAQWGNAPERPIDGVALALVRTQRMRLLSSQLVEQLRLARSTVQRTREIMARAERRLCPGVSVVFWKE